MLHAIIVKKRRLLLVLQTKTYLIMRKNMILMLLAVAAISFSCKKIDDTNALMQAFNTMFPGNDDANWETKGGYEVATFTEDGNETNAWFDDDGNWYMTDTDIDYTELPQAVRTAFEASEWASWTIDDVEMIERPDMAPVYSIEAENGNQEIELIYAQDGTLIDYQLDIDGTDDDDDDNSDMLPTELPASVTDYINTNYPGAVIVDRDNDDGMLEVDIRHNNQIVELIFTTAGIWVETTIEFDDNYIPDVVADAINASEYSGYEYEDIEYINSAANGEYYEVEMEFNDHEVTLKITMDGIISVLEEDNDDDDDDDDDDK